jgi:uncharacterized protein
MFDFLFQPWPWYISGPLIGLTIPLLLRLGNKSFGISSNLRHMCAILPSRIPFFDYNWRKESWNLVFAVGILLGGFLGSLGFSGGLELSPKTTADLAALNITVGDTLAPITLFGWASLFTLKGFLLMVVGGFLVGFGTAYAGGCTSGHSIMGLSDFQLPSLVATLGFFAGGLISTHLLLPLILKL